MNLALLASQCLFIMTSCHVTVERFLSSFAKSRKLTISSDIFVCLSIRMEPLGYHWKNFHEILYFSIFRKSFDKFQFPLNSDSNRGYFTWRPVYIYENILLKYSYNKKYFGQNLQKNQNTHFVFNNVFPKIVWWGNLREGDHWRDPDADGRIILRWIFRKWEEVVGTGWSWLRIGTGGGHLWVRWWTFGFQKCGKFLD